MRVATRISRIGADLAGIVYSERILDRKAGAEWNQCIEVTSAPFLKISPTCLPGLGGWGAR